MGMIIVAVLSQFDELLDRSASLFASQLGESIIMSPRRAFVETDYYNGEMGDGLKKQIIAFRQLKPVNVLPKLKLLSNQLEETVAQEKAWPMARPINLDPGYIDVSKVVLASTKPQGHRFYLDDGIFGEMTLIYRNGDWQTLDWTYPDFRLPEVRAHLKKLRQSF